MVRSLILSILFILPGVSHAGNLYELFSGYQKTDINNKCQVNVARKHDSLRIGIKGLDGRESLEAIILEKTITDLENFDSHVALDSDYDGTTTLVLVKAPNNLHVILTWEDNENGVDRSTFCNLRHN